MEIGKIVEVEIDEKYGCIVRTYTTENLEIRSIAMVIYNSQEHYFQISNIKTYCDNLIEVKMREISYRRFKNNVNNLLDLPLILITDKEKISKIEKESG